MPSVSIDVDLEEFSDSDLVQEVIDRKLVDDVIEASGRRRKVADTRTLVTDAYGDLMSRRTAAAAAELRAAIGALVPADLLDAYEAILAGRRDDAICRLDAYLELTSERRAA